MARLAKKEREKDLVQEQADFVVNKFLERVSVIKAKVKILQDELDRLDEDIKDKQIKNITKNFN